MNEAKMKIHNAFTGRLSRRLKKMGFRGDVLRDPPDVVEKAIEEEVHDSRNFDELTLAIKRRPATTDEEVAYLESDLTSSEWIAAELRRDRINADFREAHGRAPTEAELIALTERDEQSVTLREGWLVIKGGMDEI